MGGNGPCILAAGLAKGGWRLVSSRPPSLALVHMMNPSQRVPTSRHRDWVETNLSAQYPSENRVMRSTETEGGKRCSDAMIVLGEVDGNGLVHQRFGGDYY